MIPAKRRPKRAYHQHGQNLVTRALPFLVTRLADTSVPDTDLSPVERAARLLREDMLEDLGGAEAVSATQRALLDASVGSLIVLQSIDAYLFKLAAEDGLVNKRSRRTFPIVTDRMRVADSLARQLTTLGLERKAKPAQDLDSYLSARYPSSPDQGRGSSPNESGDSVGQVEKQE
jgi:hypothetical protein